MYLGVKGTPILNNFLGSWELLGIFFFLGVLSTSF
jgi:hypothetical protein